MRNVWMVYVFGAIYVAGLAAFLYYTWALVKGLFDEGGEP